MYYSSPNHTFLLGRLIPGAGRGGFTPYSDLNYWDPPPERSNIFQASAYERVAISLVEVYERVGKSVISAGKRLKRLICIL